MSNGNLNWIANFIWGIADDVLRDVYTRGKYRDAILPMVVVRRLDAVLEPTKSAVLSMKKSLDKAGVTQQDAALRKAAGHAFYNASPYTLADLKNRGKAAQLKADFETYLDGFSPNVQEILQKFKFHNQIPTLHEHDLIGALIEKFLDRSINLSPQPVKNEDGSIRLPGLDNHAMGTIFEELIRRFNEENNEEAGEHFTPRDVVRLMADLILLPIANDIQSATYTVYDGACGTGGMLTVAEDRLKELAAKQGKQVSIHLFGQESQPETYAISKADLLLKGEGADAEQFVHGSTLSADGFISREFDFMLSNPPYGKSWKLDLEKLGGKSGIKDPRFLIEHADDPEFSLVTRSSDGQMLFLANKLAKMKENTKLGSRIAEVHNGSSLFTGDAGQGESNIRRWILENDWLDAIVALPLNMFYNTGIATYIWVLSNRKPEYRRGKVQLIDATQWFSPLRKNLGKKNCEFADADIDRITKLFLDFEETDHSKIFDNQAFGYWKITVERPLRLCARFAKKAIEGLRFASGDEELRRELWAEFGHDIYDRFSKIRGDLEKWLKGEADADSGDDDGDSSTPKAKAPEKKRKKLLTAKHWERDRKLVQAANALADAIGTEQFDDFNVFDRQVEATAKELKLKLSAAERKLVARAMSWRDEDAQPVVKKVHKPGKAEADPIHGLYQAATNGGGVIEYEPDSELRDTEQVPLLEDGGIEAFFKREVLPHAPDAWIDNSKTKIGYEISFTRYFYKPPKLRTLDEIKADILALERETEGLLEEVIGEEVP